MSVAELNNDKEAPYDLGKSIKIALIQRGKNQQWLARKSHVDIQVVQRHIKKTDAPVTLYEKYAKIFKVKTTPFMELGQFESWE